MNKISSTVKKHFLVSIISLVIIVLAASHLQVFSKVNSGPNKVLAFEQGILGANSDKASVGDPVSADNAAAPSTPSSVNISNHPFPNCQTQANYISTPTSSTFKHSAYDVSMMTTNSPSPKEFFQDINGDNLPDYMEVISWQYGTTPEVNFVHTGCVYLNNGSGWNKTYICNATITINQDTGAVLASAYKGDCADTSLSDNKEE